MDKTKLSEEQIKHRFDIYAQNIKMFLERIDAIKQSLGEQTYLALKDAHSKYYEHVLKLSKLDLKTASQDDVSAFYFLGKEIDILFDNYASQMSDFGLKPISYK